jgi:predicted Zn-dependent peptidase
VTPLCRAVCSSRLFLLLALSVVSDTSAAARPEPRQARVPVRELRLDNGMKLLLVHQPASTSVVAGWMVGVGSADDPADRTGLSHLLEHMMFKGTETIGATDFSREKALLDQLDRLWETRAALQSKLDHASGKKQLKSAKRIQQLTAQLEDVQEQAERIVYQGEFSFLYSAQGGTRLDANTLQDLTLYFVTLPADKLELWFWLESDRLLSPVFRQLDKEVEVILEERRLRIGSTPTGTLDESVRAVFWGDHPYSWNPMGQADHLKLVTRSGAIEFFQSHYRADNLTAALVGAFDVEQVEDWARHYFGRIPTGAARSAPSIATDLGAFTAKRMEEVCACPPQARVLYPTARFGHVDNYALQLLSAIMNGRTGRLYRNLVLGSEIAFSAYTQQVPLKQAGVFNFQAESKGSTDPESLVLAWDEELRRLLAEKPSQEEIDRARNRLTADAFRTLKEPEGLLKQLLIYEGLGDWRYLNAWSAHVQKITSEDIVAVAEKYLVPERRTVAIYRRTGRQAEASASPEVISMTIENAP